MAFDLPQYVHYSLDHEFGLRSQLCRGLLPDGTWCETSTLYQFYCLQALLIHAEAALRHGIDLYGDGALARMARAATRHVLPDLRMAPINDTAYDCPVSPIVLATCRARFEDSAVADLADRRMDAAAEEIGRREMAFMELCRNGGRMAADLLLHIAGTVPHGGRVAGSRPSDSGRSQAFILRDDDRGHFVLMEHGPKNAAHMHYERLSVLAYLSGRPVLLDRGSTAYHLPIYNFYRYTPAHNTVGAGNWHHLHQSVSAILENAPLQCAARVEIHQGVMMTRRLSMEGALLRDEIQIECAIDRAHPYFDFYLHPPGEPQLDELQLRPFDLEKLYFGYDRMTEVRRWEGLVPPRIVYKNSNYDVCIHYERRPDPIEWILVKTPGVGNQPDQSIHSLILRTPAAERLHFVTTYQVMQLMEPENISR
jgi:hypothetical protein